MVCVGLRQLPFARSRNLLDPHTRDPRTREAAHLSLQREPATLDGLDRLGQFNEEQMALKIEEQLRNPLAPTLGKTRWHYAATLAETPAGTYPGGVSRTRPVRLFRKSGGGKLLEGALPKVLASPTGFSRGENNMLAFGIDVMALGA
jgi:hypothetical protein